MPRAKADNADTPVDPNKLVRQQAGTYRTADERFEVRQAALGWFLIDSTVTDQLGQELTRGPFATLAAVNDELPEARRTTIKSVPPPKKAAAAKSSAAKGAASKGGSAAKAKKEPAPAPTWIDRLPKADAAQVRRLIHALELDGIADAEALVRTARRSTDPQVATRVLEKRLDALVDELPAAGRAAASQLVRRIAELITSDGTKLFDPIPGWALVEVEAGAEPPPRRIVVRPAARRR
jgi:hypothetical protein